MSDNPPRLPEDEEFIACPNCTIQIPADTPVCPHCRQGVPRPERPPSPEPVPAAPPAPPSPWDRYGKRVKVAVPILLALLVLFLVYQRWSAQRVRIVPNPALPLQVEEERVKDAVVLRGTVTNRGDDVPDLSLRSVGVIVEFVYRDGRREKKTVFPKAEFRGEGALLRGETGTFEVETPVDGLSEIVLSTEIVDLGMGRKLIPPRRK